jgi:hypothetical protein
VADDQALVREGLMTLLQMAAGIDPAVQGRLLAAATAATAPLAPAAELPDELTPREAEPGGVRP